MDEKEIKASLRHLKKHPKLGAIIAAFEKPTLGPRDPIAQAAVSAGTYAALSRSIIYQQLSGKAAATIYTRYAANFTNNTPNQKEFFSKKRETLMKAGLSNQKMNYLYDLSEKFRDGFIKPELFPKMTDEEIREHLVAVKGIGVWTADMFLMFTLKRPDVLPTLDLGVRKGFKKLFKLRDLPDHDKMTKLAKPWEPYRTFACLYLWKLADEGNPNRPK